MNAGFLESCSGCRHGFNSVGGNLKYTKKNNGVDYVTSIHCYIKSLIYYLKKKQPGVTRMKVDFLVEECLWSNEGTNVLRD